jgi:S-methylmethionine-dependent homocysteine/selenocysteine methylase
MAKYRDHLPQLSGELFLTDGGIETTLIFHEGLELPYFAAVDLLKHDEGYAALQKYFRTYAVLAQRYGVGCILESATWRASPDWGTKLGHSAAALADLNRKAIALLQEIRHEFEDDATRIVISGCIGPRGDGYNPAGLMNEDEAERYHAMQAAIFRDSEADMVTAITMNYAAEALGLTRAAQAAGMPVVISFTVETDGRLPTGQTLREAIEEVDDATGYGPAYYMINCAHPTHFASALAAGGPWLERIRGLRANASAKSHAELDEATELDAGNPVTLGLQYRELKGVWPQLNVMGGCCGTDHRHVEAVCKTCLPLWATSTPCEGRKTP